MSVSSLSAQLLQRLADGELAARQPFERRTSALRLRLGVRSLFDFHERQLTADLVQAVFDGGITDAEILLHLLDRSVAPNESRYEHLVLGCQLCQRGQFEVTFEGDVLVDESDALDFKPGSTAELRERLPIKSHNRYKSTYILSYSSQILIILIGWH